MLPVDKHTSDHSMGHDISADIIKKLPESLRNPILVLEGQHPKTVVVLTELKNKDDKNVIVPIALDLRSTDSTVNKITSVYGKNNIRSYLEKHQSQIIAYNEEKTDRLFTTIGYQLPKTTSAICFDNSIAYSMQNVKGSLDDLNKSKPQKEEKKSPLSEIAEVLEMSASEIESKPSDIKQLLIYQYINSPDMPSEELKKSLLSIIKPSSSLEKENDFSEINKQARDKSSSPDKPVERTEKKVTKDIGKKKVFTVSRKQLNENAQKVKQRTSKNKDEKTQAL